MRPAVRPVLRPALRPALRATWSYRAAALVTVLAVCASARAEGTSVVPLHAEHSKAEAIRAAAPMRIARAAHTATTLPDGRVLVAGGFTEAENAATSAEIYDPVANRFVPLPRMVTLRHSHTATLLPGGRVLIVGGYATGNEVVTKAELFDPKSNAFSSTGSMGAARAGHVAVLLRNGKVLIAGGVGPAWSFLSSAELFDPATGRFTPTGAMAVARESHIAARLDDGRVLIAGGHRGRRADMVLYSSTEMYDAAAGTFRASGDMRVRRHKHDATVLPDGRVLITGGTDERDMNGVYRSTELFDPRSEVFTLGAVMTQPRYKHNGASVLLADGRVLIAGGAANVEAFDPRGGSFAAVAGERRMSGQFSAVAALQNGSVLITGGYGNGRGPTASAWLYTPD